MYQCLNADTKCNACSAVLLHEGSSPIVSHRAPPSAAGVSETLQAHRGLDPGGLPTESDAWTPSAPPASQASISAPLNTIIFSPSSRNNVSRHPVCLQALFPADGAKQEPRVLAQAVPALPRPRPPPVIPVRTAQPKHLDSSNSLIGSGRDYTTRCFQDDESQPRKPSSKGVQEVKLLGGGKQKFVFILNSDNETLWLGDSAC